MNVAILSPNQNAYSETFIQRHRQLPFAIFFYYGSSGIPNRLENYDALAISTWRHYLRRVKVLLGVKDLMKPDQVAFADSLKRNKIQLVFAEYGTTGSHVYPICRKLNIPLLVHFHGFDASEKSVLQNYRKSYLGMFSYASAVVAVSDQMVNALIQIGCPKEKISKIPYGPSPIFLKLEKEEIEYDFLACGRFVEKKAPHLTIAAFKKVVEKHAQCKMIMCGDGPLLAVCKDLVRLWQLEDNVIFYGVVNTEEFCKLLSKTRVFVQHSKIAENGDSEGMPVAVLEALASGTPVISTLHAGIPECVRNGETGYVVAENDVDSMAEYMTASIDEPIPFHSMGMNARRLILGNFTLEKSLESLKVVAENCVGKLQ